jgi:tetratricopeptide (TPR) repeat protein
MRARANRRDFVFASRPGSVAVLEYAVQTMPDDANAHLHLGNLLAHLGRVAEAVPHWEQAAELDASLSIAFRNLGLHSRVIENDLAGAVHLYRKSIAARPEDQTLYRDLAEILVAAEQRPEAIAVLESVPSERPRRADVLLMLAEAYIDERRFTDAIDLLVSTSRFVNWEGGNRPWALFNRAHLERGQAQLEADRPEAALQDFEAAITYPENLGVGRSNKPEHASAHYWRGQALQALGRVDEARTAWEAGAAGAEGSEQQNEYREKCRAALSEQN